jgi:hypothetical protein
MVTLLGLIIYIFAFHFVVTLLGLVIYILTFHFMVTLLGLIIYVLAFHYGHMCGNIMLIKDNRLHTQPLLLCPTDAVLSHVLGHVSIYNVLLMCWF